MKRKQFEHLYERVRYSSNMLFNVQEYLTEKGSEGWENTAFQIVHPARPEYTFIDYYFVFKREKSNA